MSNLASKTADALKRAVDSHQKGDLKTAANHYKTVLKHHSGNFLANNYYGLILMQEGRYKYALKHFQTALKNKPDWAEAQINIAQLYLKLDDPDNAKSFAQKAVKSNPSIFKAWMILGSCAHELGDQALALDAFQNAVKRASAANPDQMAEALNALGGVYADYDMYDESIKWFEKALEVKHDYALSWNNLGLALRMTNKHDKALDAYDRAIDIAPSYTSAISNRADLLTFLGRGEEAYNDYKQIYSHPGFSQAMHSNYLMALHYMPDIDMNDIFKAQCEWGERFANHLKPKHRKRNQHKQSKQIYKIGLVSSSFACHPVGFMILPAMENINKDQFHLYYYSDTAHKKHDFITDKLKATATKWTDTWRQPNAHFMQSILDDDLDILFDLSGHSEGTRLAVFGHRLAPVQVQWVGGLFGTSGIKDMDWILGDHVEIPEGDDKWYTEKIYRMPDDYICYQPPYYLPDFNRDLPALKNGYVTFANFNNGPKTNSKSIRLWADVLKSVPDSKFMVKNKIYDHDSVRQDFISKMQAHGIDKDRLIFKGNTSHEDHLRSLNDVDIALDPTPYTGGLTTCESLMMGVPTVTWPGPHFAGRHTATHLTAAGYSHFIANSDQDYIHIAQKWACDLDNLCALRIDMRADVLASPLCDGKRFASAFEKSIQDMCSA